MNPNAVSRKPEPSKAEHKVACILIFSPDLDLARSMAMLLEEDLDVVLATKLEQLRENIGTTNPDVLLIDLFSFQGEIAKLLLVLQSSRPMKPVVLLRGYQQWAKEIEEVIQQVGTIIFYKPVDFSLIVGGIHQIVGARGLNNVIEIQ